MYVIASDQWASDHLEKHLVDSVWLTPLLSESDETITESATDESESVTANPIVEKDSSQHKKSASHEIGNLFPSIRESGL